MKSNRPSPKQHLLHIATVGAPLSDLYDLIQTARSNLAQAVDSALTTLYWRIIRRVHQDIPKSKRADYGAEIVSALRRQLSWTHFKRAEGLLKRTLERKLHQTVLLARARLGAWKSADQGI